jgi:hypothetical protein
MKNSGRYWGKEKELQKMLVLLSGSKLFSCTVSCYVRETLRETVQERLTAGKE